MVVKLKKAKPDSSVIFIGEEQPLLLQNSWGDNHEEQEEEQRSTKNKTGYSHHKTNGSENGTRNKNGGGRKSGVNSSGTILDGRDNSSSKSKKNKASYYPCTFFTYLLSENSVLMRLLSSLCPPFGRFKRIAVDAEGSFLSGFLLTSTLYWGFVNTKGESRTYALLLSCSITSSYVFLISALTWLLSLCTKTIITFRQIVCVLGYGLFGHAVTLLACEVGSNNWFMPLMSVVGGLDSLRICLILLARTPVPACRFVLCTPIAITHLLFLVYLHFAIMKDE